MPRPPLFAKKSSLTTGVLNVGDAAGTLVIDRSGNPVIVFADRQLLVHRAALVATSRPSQYRPRAPLAD